MGKRPVWLNILFGAIAVIAFAIICISTYGALFATSTHNDCVVTDKDRTRSSEGGSEMRVYTENCGTLKVGDNWFVGQFNAADIYGGLKEGNTYDFETRGYRIPIISMFPNIIEVVEK